MSTRSRGLILRYDSQFTVMGGTLKHYQIITSPVRLVAQNITLDQLTTASKKANVLAGGRAQLTAPSDRRDLRCFV